MRKEVGLRDARHSLRGSPFSIETRAPRRSPCLVIRQGHISPLSFYPIHGEKWLESSFREQNRLLILTVSESMVFGSQNKAEQGCFCPTANATTYR